jgi:hypothetical protein
MQRRRESELLARDEFVLESLRLMFTVDADTAFDTVEFELGVFDDATVDISNGEGDADWYLMYLSTADRFLVARERGGANVFKDLS